MAFKKAERKNAKARILLTGPAGSGKSHGALLIAKGLGGKTAAIDTERGSLSLYSDALDFDVLDLGAPFQPEKYIKAIKEAEEAGYDNLVIDSITHEWSGVGGLLEDHGKMPGNSWANWAKITPRHQKFIDAMLQSKMNIIATVRSKTTYLESEKNGKKVIEKAGTEPQQRDGMDYEFTIVLDVCQRGHNSIASKDRTHLWDNDRMEILTEKHGQEISDWLQKGIAVVEELTPVEDKKPVADPNAITSDQTKEIRSLVTKHFNSEDGKKEYAELLKLFGVTTGAMLTNVQASELIEKIRLAKELTNG